MSVVEKPEAMRAGAEAVGVGAGAPFVLGPHPFARGDEIIRGFCPSGFTIAQIVDELTREGMLHPAFRRYVHVWVGRHEVPRELWARVRPKADARVTVVVIPQGGGSNPLKIVLQLAVVAAAAYIGFSIGGVWGAVAAAAITMAGNYLVNALIPIKQPEPIERKPRYSLSGASNQARPHEPVPMVLGRRRIYPPRAANFYTVMVGQDVYLRCLFQPSVSWVDREAVRIGETPIEGYDGVTLNWHTKPDDATPTQYFAQTPAEDYVSAPVKAADGWMTRGAPIKCTRISIDMGFNAGLYEIKKSSGEPSKQRSVSIEVRYGPRGGSPEAATPAPIAAGGVNVKTWTMASIDAYRETLEWTVPEGEWDVHVRRTTPDSPDNDVKISDEIAWVCVRSFRNETPIADMDGTPWVELQLKASEQLSGVVDSFNFVATSIVHEATADGPGAAWIASRNPADLFLAATYRPFSDLDLDDDERIFEAVADWRALCEAEGWHCDLVEDQELSVGELLLRIAACGRARPSIDFGALTVVVDWEKPEGVQIFTARNVQKFRGELLYPEDVHGLRLRFQNAAQDYDDDVVVVYANGYTEANASRFETLEIRDKTDAGEVEREGQRILAERIARPEKFIFEQDVEYIVSGEGARAWLAHPAALIGQVSARVLEIVERDNGAGGVQSGAVLDEPTIMDVGKSYALAWRSTAGGALTTAEVEGGSGESQIVWFVVEPATLPAPGDLAAFGEQSIEVLDVVINRITPKPGLRAEIECVPYAPELQHLDETPVTSYRAAAAAPPALPGAYTGRRSPQATDKLLTRTGLVSLTASAQAAAAVDDGIITPAEKRELIPRLEAILDAAAALLAKVNELAIDAGTPVVVTYVAAITLLQTRLDELTDPVAWDDPSDDTEVPSPAQFRAAVSGAEIAERALRTLIASHRVPQLVTAVRGTAEALLREALDRLESYRNHNALLHLLGQPIGTAVKNEIEQRIEGQTAIVTTLNLIGAKSGDNLSFILDTSTVKVDPTTTLAAKFTEISASFASVNTLLLSKASVTQLNEAIASESSARATSISTVQASLQSQINTKAAVTYVDTVVAGESSARASAVASINASLSSQSASITQLFDVVVTPAGGASAKAVLLLTAGGKVAGVSATNNGAVSALDMQFDSYVLRGPAGQSLLTADGSGVYMPDLRVERFTAGSVSTPSLADRATFDYSAYFADLGGWRSVPLSYAYVNSVAATVTTGPSSSQRVKIGFGFCCQRDGGDDDNLAVSIERSDGAILQVWDNIQIHSGKRPYFITFFDDSVGANTTYTYRPIFRSLGDGAPFWYEVTFDAEVKKK